MQIAFRRNPKTVGWARRIAISLLVGAAVFALAFPLGFFVLLNHYNRVTPADPQNMLGALTVAALLGVGAAFLAFAASLLLSFFLGLARSGGKASSPAVLS